MNEVPPETAPKTPSGASTKSGRGEPLPQLPDASIFQFAPVPPKPEVEPAPEPAPTPPVQYETKAPPAKRAAGSAMFEALVSGEDDLTGFVAYGFYKQNKRDFLTAFAQIHARAPDASEIRAYMTGEVTARRVATYRHLAESFLASYRDGRLGERDGAAPASAAADRDPPRTLTQLLSRSVARRGRARSSWLAAAYIAFLILLLAGMVVLIRSGFSPLGGIGR